MKKTTEAFNNYFGHHGNDKKSSSEQPYSLPMIGVGQDEDSAKMPPPKLGMIQINITSIVTNNFWSQAILAKTIINWDHFYVIMAFNIC